MSQDDRTIRPSGYPALRPEKKEGFLNMDLIGLRRRRLGDERPKRRRTEQSEKRTPGGGVGGLGLLIFIRGILFSQV